MKRYFITGTDTNCGKTYVTCQFLNGLNQRQKRALALKPVASGLVEHNNLFYNEDVALLQQHNRHSSRLINGWQFPSPVSPHLAAKEADVTLSVEAIAAFCLDKQYEHLDYLLIEGAGGLLVPLNDQETWLDFLKLTQIPVILVVGMRLGCLNHALLTDFVLKVEQIPCMGWVANCLDQEMKKLAENIDTLKSKMHIPLLATCSDQGVIECDFL